jgi:hypothetical protein
MMAQIPDWLISRHSAPPVPAMMLSYDGHPYCIYGLIDPETGELRYIGKTRQSLLARLRAHMQDKADCHRVHWLKSLAQRGLKPHIVPIEIGEGMCQWQEAETFWIAWARRNGARLTNATSGGDGVPDLPPETRERMRKVWLGRKHSPETLAKLRAARRLRTTSDATKRKMSAAQSGRKILWLDKIAVANRKLTPDHVEIIKARLANGEGVQNLAAEYGVHRTTMSKIKAGTYLLFRQGGGE